MTVTRKTVNEAHGSLIHAESLLDILIKADVGLTEGEAVTVCDMLLGLISQGSKVLDALNCDYDIELEKRRLNHKRVISAQRPFPDQGALPDIDGTGEPKITKVLELVPKPVESSVNSGLYLD
ncbi:MAG: hypothetical protein LBU28_03300 [Spirochaetaceae bacterium]|jgi:hypothetical protein|nr:hypothetical protein [Spirochaetaceae bacterium]